MLRIHYWGAGCYPFLMADAEPPPNDHEDELQLALALVPKYLSKAQLGDPRSTRTSLDFPLWCAEQDVAAQEPDGDGAVEETGDM